MATTHEQIVAAYEAYLAENEKFEGKGVGARRFKTIDGRKWRWCAALRPHPRKQNTAAFLNGVIALLDAGAQNTALGFGGGFETLTCDVKFPTVKGTT